MKCKNCRIYAGANNIRWLHSAANDGRPISRMFCYASGQHGMLTIQLVAARSARSNNSIHKFQSFAGMCDPLTSVDDRRKWWSQIKIGPSPTIRLQLKVIESRERRRVNSAAIIGRLNSQMSCYASALNKNKPLLKLVWLIVSGASNYNLTLLNKVELKQGWVKAISRFLSITGK